MKTLAKGLAFKRSKGFALVTAAALILAATWYSIQVYQEYEFNRRVTTLTAEAGRHLQQHVFAVMKLISAEGNAAAVGAFNGTTWLKGADCAGAASDNYMADCAFNDTAPFGVTYTTNVAVVGGITQATILVPFPQVFNGVEPIHLALKIRSVAAGFLDGTTPIAQTFVDFQIDEVNDQIIAQVSGAPSTDIWLRTDGTNSMGADLDLGGNDINNVAAIFASPGGVVDTALTLEIGSAMNAAGILSTDQFISAAGVNGFGESLVAVGTLTAAGADFTGEVTIGDAVNSSSTRITFVDNAIGSNQNIRLQANNGDLFLTNDAGNATLIADKVYLKDVNRFASQAVYNMTLAKHGDLIQKPTCTGFTPQIFTSFSGLAQDPARPISAFSVTAVDAGSNWRIDVKAKTDGPGDVPDSLLEADIVVAVKCS